MKILNNLIKLIIALTIVFNALSLLADDPVPPNFVVKIKTPTPCLDNLPQWNGPKWYKICTDTVFNLNNGKQPPENWKTCCYYIKYYDRVEVSNSGNTRQYQTNVVGVFYEGSDCEKRSKETIIQEFQEALYQKLCSEDETYFNKIVNKDGDDWGEATTTAYVYTTGGCYQKDEQDNIIRDAFNKPLPCNQNSYCCRESKDIKLKRMNGKLYVEYLAPKSPPYFELFGTSCPTSCKKGCNNVMMQSSIDMNCNTDCNEGEWEPNEKLIPMPTCPGCTVKVFYYTRTTPPCPQYGNKEANDIYLDRIVVNDDPSGPCGACTTLSAQQIHETVFQDLKNSEFRNLPEINGQCKDYFRFFQSSCWRDETVPGYNDYDFNYEPPKQFWVPPFRVIMKCAGDNCCKRVFRICKDSQGNIMPPVQIGPSAPSDLNCGIVIEPCFFICD